MKVDITCCARCGEDHNGLEFTEMEIPILEVDLEWTHWAECPNGKGPVLLLIMSDGEKSCPKI